jgi:hypothetical protein
MEGNMVSLLDRMSSITLDMNSNKIYKGGDLPFGQSSIRTTDIIARRSSSPHPDQVLNAINQSFQPD